MIDAARQRAEQERQTRPPVGTQRTDQRLPSGLTRSTLSVPPQYGSSEESAFVRGGGSIERETGQQQAIININVPSGGYQETRERQNVPVEFRDLFTKVQTKSGQAVGYLVGGQVQKEKPTTKEVEIVNYTPEEKEAKPSMYGGGEIREAEKLSFLQRFFGKAEIAAVSAVSREQSRYKEELKIQKERVLIEPLSSFRESSIQFGVAGGKRFLSGEPPVNQEIHDNSKQNHPQSVQSSDIFPSSPKSSDSRTKSKPENGSPESFSYKFGIPISHLEEKSIDIYKSSVQRGVGVIQYMGGAVGYAASSALLFAAEHPIMAGATAGVGLGAKAIGGTVLTAFEALGTGASIYFTAEAVSAEPTLGRKWVVGAGGALLTALPAKELKESVKSGLYKKYGNVEFELESMNFGTNEQSSTGSISRSTGVSTGIGTMFVDIPLKFSFKLPFVKEKIVVNENVPYFEYIENGVKKRVYGEADTGKGSASAEFERRRLFAEEEFRKVRDNEGFEFGSAIEGNENVQTIKEVPKKYTFEKRLKLFRDCRWSFLSSVCVNWY